MKKNKTVAFMLAATLMVGGTFLGTKAWFTDNGNASSDLVITMGNLDLEVDSGAWQLYDPSEATPVKDQKVNFKNVRPGDSFWKRVYVTNKGSLTQKLSVSGGEQTSNKDLFSICLYNLKDNNKLFNAVTLPADGEAVWGDYDKIVDKKVQGAELEPGQTAYFDIQVNLTADAIGNKYQDFTFNFEKMMEKITIEANQFNHK